MSTPSLLRLFEPPENHYGQFGWVCGFSADAGFLDSAAERFTGKSASLRARQGQVVLGVMLDPFHEPISVLDAPGVADLPLRIRPGEAFRLMHAKIALLGFRGRSANWRLRVIVTTGNWTQQTLEDSLDLAWCFDVDCTELGRGDNALAQRCADVVKANELLSWLGEHYDRSLVEFAGRDSETSLAARELAEWADLCARSAGETRPRIFDNRECSLLEGLLGYLHVYADSKRRNLLALGSGFFEADAGGGVPPVLDKIVHEIDALGLLTKSPDVDIYVNEKACQSVAISMDAIEAAGWHVRAPSRPKMFGSESSRTLHAKFIFSANSRTEACTSAWLYLGSGNLTPAGFLKRAGKAGNLEAGVFLDFPRLPWSTPAEALTIEMLLPLQRNGEGRISPNAPPSIGDPMPPRPPAFLAGPTAFLQWRTGAEDRGSLSLPAGSAPGPADLSVLDVNGEACARDDEGWHWLGAMPRQVALRWDKGEKGASVPVVDEQGRIAAGKAPALELADLAFHLMGFPARVDDEGDEDPYDPFQGRAAPGISQPRQFDAGQQVTSSPVRTMMLQLEEIARRQTMVSEADWPFWCVRLEEILIRAAGSESLTEFLRFGLDPFEVLKIDASRPAHACIQGGKSAARHDAALANAAAAWGLGELQTFKERP
jgi:hypothetical protein